MSANLTINVYNEHNWALDKTMLKAVLARIAVMDFAEHVDVYPMERVPDPRPVGAPGPIGWLEWTIRVRYQNSNTWFTVGCIQRSIGAEVEFHS